MYAVVVVLVVAVAVVVVVVVVVALIGFLKYIFGVDVGVILYFQP